MTATLLLCSIGWALGWLAFGRLRRLVPADGAGSGPEGIRFGSGSEPETMSIVIPARNEAMSLPALLGDLSRHRPAGAQVIVVDDHSTDATAELASSFDFVEVVDPGDLPRDWTGKSWACHTGAAHATGDVLVFLDADVRLGAGSIERIVERLHADPPRSGAFTGRHRRAGGRTGLVSVQPWHRTVKAYEQLSALFNVLAIMGTGAGGRAQPRGAFGPVLATRAEDYRAVGGHASVADQVVEDVALARRYRAAGLGVEILGGRGSVEFRMYPAGLGQLVEGWTKNFATGAASTGPMRLAVAIAWVAALGTAALALVDGLQGQIPWAVGVLLYAAFVVQLQAMFAQVGRFGTVTALAYPGLLVFFLVVFARSLWRTYVRRSVRWRGRTIPIGHARS